MSFPETFQANLTPASRPPLWPSNGFLKVEAFERFESNVVGAQLCGVLWQVGEREGTEKGTS